MKKTLITLFTFLSLTVNVFCQLPNLNKAKEKIQPSQSKEAEPTKTNTKDLNEKLDGSPAYNPEDPTYRAYSKVKDHISSANSHLIESTWLKNVEGRNNDVLNCLEVAQANMKILKEEQKQENKPYYKEFEKNLTDIENTRKDKFNNYSEDQKYDKKLESYYNFATSSWAIQDTTLEPSYKGYYALKNEFQKNRPLKYQDNYVQSRIQKIDNYFQIEVYKIIPTFNTEVDKIIAEMYEKNARNEAKYLLNAKNYLQIMEKPFEEITYHRNFLFEKKEEIDVVLAKLNKERNMLTEYLQSGKCDAHREKYRQELIEAVRLGRAAMTNASYEKMAKEGSQGLTVKRVSITNANWVVKKNEFGYPLYKYLPVDLAVTDESGKCFLAYGQIRKNYEGGGNYGSEFFSYWGKQEEMNCANINK